MKTGGGMDWMDDEYRMMDVMDEMDAAGKQG
jgi:hypothetical protein